MPIDKYIILNSDIYTNWHTKRCQIVKIVKAIKNLYASKEAASSSLSKNTNQEDSGKSSQIVSCETTFPKNSNKENR